MNEPLKNLDHFLKKWGWSHYRFSKESGVPKQTISGWYCRGKGRGLNLLNSYLKELDFRLTIEKEQDK